MDVVQSANGQLTALKALCWIIYRQKVRPCRTLEKEEHFTMPFHGRLTWKARIFFIFQTFFPQTFSFLKAWSLCDTKMTYYWMLHMGIVGWMHFLYLLCEAQSPERQDLYLHHTWRCLGKLQSTNSWKNNLGSCYWLICLTIKKTLKGSLWSLSHQALVSILGRLLHVL